MPFRESLRKVTKRPQDSRPESYKIDANSIKLLDILPSKGMVRREWLESSPSLCKSVEDLEDRYNSEKQSLGIIVPKTVDGVNLVKRTPAEEKEWKNKENAIINQGNLYGDLNSRAKCNFELGE